MLNRFFTWGALLLLVVFTLIACLPAFGFIPATNGLAIDARDDSNFVLDNDGTLWNWGISFGSGYPYVPQSKPAVVTGLTDVSAVAGGPDFCTVSKKDGSIWELQEKADGSSSWVENLELTGVAAVTGGSGNRFALKRDGTVWEWEYRLWKWGQCPDLTDIIMVSGSSLALKRDGTVLEKLGLTWSPVSGLTGIKSVAEGWSHCLALKHDGTVWAWGKNYYGQLGDGTAGMGTEKSSPVQVVNLAGVCAIASGGNHSLALKDDGTVWAWGGNYYGQLGDGTDGTGTNKSSPVQVNGLTNVVAIAAGANHSLAMKEDGTVWAWGANDSGQLGNDSRVNSNVPVLCFTLDPQTFKDWPDEKSGVALNKEWTVKFNAPLDPTTVNDQNIYVLDNNNNRVNVTVFSGTDDQTVLVKPPAAGYAPATDYFLYLLKTIKSQEGSALQKPIKMKFATQAQ